MADAPERGWGVLAPLTLGRRPAATVNVHSTTVPAGGLLTFMASGFAPGAMLRVRVDYGAPIAAYALDAGGRTPETSRVPVPSGRPGPHVLTFEDGTADFDLLIRTTPNTATVTLEPAEVVAGGRLRFAGRHFPAGATVHVKLDATGDPMPVTASPRGTISGSVAIPTDTSVGRHELRFLASDPPTSTAVTITVR